MDTTNLDDLLNQAEAQETSNDEWVLDLDYETKDFYVDEHGAVEIKNKTIGDMSNHVSVKGESYSQYVEFKMNRYYDGVDLTKMTLAIYFDIPNIGSDENRPINVYYNEREIKFGWAVPVEVSQVNVTIDLCIYARGVLSDGKNYLLKTKTAKYIINDGMELGSGIIQPTDNWYTNFVLEMDSKIEIATNAAIQSLNSSNVAKEAEVVVLQSKQIVDEKSQVVNNQFKEIQTMHKEAEQFRDEAEQFRNEAETFTPDGYANIVEQVNDTTEGIRSGFKKQAQGEEVHITDAVDGKIVEFALFGKAKQQTTSGNQLLNYDAWKRAGTFNGTSIFENNGVTITATSNDAFTDPWTNSFPEEAKIYVEEGDVITLSWEEATNANGLIIIFPNGYALGNVKVNNNSKKTLSYTVSSDVEFVTFRFGVSDAGDTISYKNIMLNKGSEPLPFEPYTGGQPSPSPEYPQEIEVPNGNVVVKSVGKNLLKNEAVSKTYNGITFTVNVDGSIHIKGQRTGTTYIDILAEIISGYKVEKLKLTDKYRCATSPYGVMKFRLTNGEYIDGNHHSIHDVGCNEIGAVYFEVTSNETVDFTYYPQIEYGDKITEYQPYKETTSTIPVTDFAGIPVSEGGNYTDQNGQQWITDEIRKFDDGTGQKVQRIEKLTYDGINLGTGWVSTVSGLTETLVQINLNNTSAMFTNSTGIVCDKFKITYYDPQQLVAYTCRQGSNGACCCYLRETDGVTDKTTADAWLQENPVTVYYILKEPIVTPLTKEDVAEIEKLNTFKPVTNISNDSNCGMSVTYGTIEEVLMLQGAYNQSKANAQEIVNVKEEIVDIKKELSDTTFKIETIIEKADLGIKETASGEEIHLTDSANAKVREFALFGKAKQQTTSGNQLANLPDVEEMSNSGIKWSCKNGVVSCSGTANGVSSTLATIFSDIPIVADTYTVSGEETYIRILKSDDTIRYYNPNKSFTIDGTEKRVTLYCQVLSGVTVNKTIYPMLNKGTTALPWERFTGGQPSPSPDYPQEIEVPNGNVVVKSCGKNLWNPTLDNVSSSNAWGGSWSREDDEYICVAQAEIIQLFSEIGGLYGSHKVLVKPNDKIAISLHGISNGYCYVLYYGKDGKFINRTSAILTPCTITIPEDVYFVGIRIDCRQTIAGQTYKFKIQIEHGSATPYEPYKETTATIPTTDFAGISVSSGGNYTDSNGQQWIANEIMKYADGSGERVQRVNIEDVTKIHGLDSSNVLGQLVLSKLPVMYTNGDKTTEFVLCNAAISKSLVDARVSEYGIAQYGQSLYFRNANIEQSKASYNAWLTENPIKVAYVLAEPIRTPLTAEEIAEIEKLHTFYPVTNISNDFDCGMRVKYLADSKNYIDNRLAQIEQALIANI